MSTNKEGLVTNIVLAGLGGQGVIRAANILAEAAFLADYDVKQSEIHGMSQRGGSVTSDVRFGKTVLSPMVPTGTADFLVVLHPTQVDNNLYQLKQGGTMISTRDIIGEGADTAVLDADATPLTSRNFNVGLLGLLSAFLPIPDEVWHEAVRRHLPKKVHDENIAAFAYGKTLRIS
jgi:indolepyruvate ferredoxin oxidoreductase beta subunit